jgi:hypothetical protein
MKYTNLARLLATHNTHPQGVLNQSRRSCCGLLTSNSIAIRDHSHTPLLVNFLKVEDLTMEARCRHCSQRALKAI